MKNLIIAIVAVLILFGCGQSYEETKRIHQVRRMKEFREDSAALKIAVLPTLDCLPLYVAEECELFDTAVDIRLKQYTAQMDCDTALIRHRVEGAISDLVRSERMIAEGTPLTYLAATDAYWLLIGNRNQRITDLKHLDDKMVAMTRYSVTDMLTDMAVDSAKLKSERVFRIQVNDVNVRSDMLENNIMDALVVTEPGATQALLKKHHVLLDSRRLDLRMGVLAMRSEVMDETNRKSQIDALLKGYNSACDSLNKYGLKHYKSVIYKYYKVSDQVFMSLPDTLKYTRASALREADVEKARKWLSTRK